MFWRFGFNSVSPIDSLLQKEDVTLEELLREEDLLSELKHNKKLTQFLSQPEILTALLDLITNDPPQDSDIKEQYRFPHVACEILASEVWSIFSAIVSEKDILQNFWNFLEKPAPLNPLQASYFAKVMIMLIGKKTGEVLSFLKHQERLLELLLKHMGTSAIVELLIKIIQAEELSDGEGMIEYLQTKNLIPELAGCLNPHNSPEVHTNIAFLFNEIINISLETTVVDYTRLVLDLRSERVITMILDFVLDREAPYVSSSLINGTTVLVELARRYIGDGDFDVHMVNSETPPEGETEEDMASMPHETVVHRTPKPDPVGVDTLIHLLLPRLEALRDILNSPAKVDAVFDENKINCFGQERLRITELLVELLRTRSPEVFAKFRELRLFEIYIDLIFKYPLNNFLHTCVCEMLHTVFSADIEVSKDLIISLFNDAHITQKIAEAQRENDAFYAEPKGSRMGFMGHLTVITESLLEVVRMHASVIYEDIKDILNEEVWTEYIKKPFAETQQRNLLELGGGRPTGNEEEDVIDGDSHATAEQIARYMAQHVTSDMPSSQHFGFDDQDEDELDDDDSGELKEHDEFDQGGIHSGHLEDNQMERHELYYGVDSDTYREVSNQMSGVQISFANFDQHNMASTIGFNGFIDTSSLGAHGDAKDSVVEVIDDSDEIHADQDEHETKHEVIDDSDEFHADQDEHDVKHAAGELDAAVNQEAMVIVTESDASVGEESKKQDAIEAEHATEHTEDKSSAALKSSHGESVSSNGSEAQQAQPADDSSSSTGAIDADQVEEDKADAVDDDNQMTIDEDKANAIDEDKKMSIVEDERSADTASNVVQTEVTSTPEAPAAAESESTNTTEATSSSTASDSAATESNDVQSPPPA